VELKKKTNQWSKWFKTKQIKKNSNDQGWNKK
jgi:hypothetical protein